MLKMMGAVMVFGACAALGLSARQNLRRRVAAADAMLLALSLIGSEISCRRAPLPEIIGELAENENPTIRDVYKRQGIYRFTVPVGVDYEFKGVILGSDLSGIPVHLFGVAERGRAGNQVG